MNSCNELFFISLLLMRKKGMTDTNNSRRFEFLNGIHRIAREIKTKLVFVDVVFFCFLSYS